MSDFSTIEDLFDSDPEYVHSIIKPGILVNKSIMVISGEPGVGKSHVTQQVGLEVACGRRALGLFPTKRSRVLYLELERQSEVTRNRFRRPGWKTEYADARGNMLYWDKEVPMIDSVIGYDKMRNLVGDSAAQVVIIDSLTVTMFDDRDLVNMKKAIGAYKEIAKEFNIAILAIQQLIKRPAAYNPKSKNYQDAPLRMDDIRGNKHLHYGADTMIAITKGAGTTRQVAFLKHNHCPLGYDSKPPMIFNFRPDTPIPLQPDLMGREIMFYLDNIKAGPNGAGITYPFLEQVTGYSRPTLVRALDHLEEFEFIETSNRQRGSSGGFGQKPAEIKVKDMDHLL